MKHDHSNSSNITESQAIFTLAIINEIHVRNLSQTILRATKGINSKLAKVYDVTLKTH